MKLEELVNKHYRELNENDLCIWDYIRTHRSECEDISIDRLGKYCNVSRSTIMRFAQKLSLKGFGELKVHLKWEEHTHKEQKKYSDRIIRIYINLLKDMQTKDFIPIFEMINRADNLFVYGSGAVQASVAKEFKRMFMCSGKFFYNVGANDESDAVTEIITEKDLVVLISLSGESSYMVDFARKMKIKNVPTISITKLKENTLSHLADESLYISTMFTKPSNGIPFEPVTSFFVLIEMLYLKYLEYEEGK